MNPFSTETLPENYPRQAGSIVCEVKQMHEPDIRYYMILDTLMLPNLIKKPVSQY